MLATLAALALVATLLVPQTPATAASPSLVVNGQAVPGGTLHIAGSSFASGDWLRLAWDAELLGRPFRVDRQGAFTASLVVPVDAPSGTHTVGAYRNKSTKETWATVTPVATVLVSVPQGAVPTPTPQPAPTPTPRPTASPAPTPAATPSPTPTPRPTVSPAPTVTPTAVPTPTPGASPAAFADLPGWKLVFADEFTTPIARGSFEAATAGKYYVSKGWRDTSGNGTYAPEIIAVENGMLDIAMGTYNGVIKVASFSPVPPGSLGRRGDLPGMRVAFRIRADRMVGFKGVPLMWPLSGLTTDGEIDFPESNFDVLPRAYMHRQGATGPSDQDYYFTPAGTTWQQWHDVVIEWVPGVRCEFFLDGASIGKSTNRVPSTPMHLSMQFETRLSGGAPDASVFGHVQVDRIAVWAVQ